MMIRNILALAALATLGACTYVNDPYAPGSYATQPGYAPQPVQVQQTTYQEGYQGAVPYDSGYYAQPVG